jgi:hypothetical protein
MSLKQGSSVREHNTFIESYGGYQLFFNNTTGKYMIVDPSEPWESPPYFPKSVEDARGLIDSIGPVKGYSQRLREYAEKRYKK